MRDTKQASLDAWDEIRPSLGRIQFYILAVLDSIGNTDYNQLTEWVNYIYDRNYNPITISSRLTELEKMGLIRRQKTEGKTMTDAYITDRGRAAL